MVLRVIEGTRAGKTSQKPLNGANMKRKIKATHNEPCPADHLVKRCKSRDVGAASPSPLKSTPALGDGWEEDSGFSSEASPPASGRSSPCVGSCSTAVVALDCEMVGTGPGGRCSALARCSVLDYHGNILYDEYIRPCRPVTDYRTRWSGVQKHHLCHATPFAQAREEILRILEGKVVVGHSVCNDFDALDMLHPAHMVRDTGTARLLSRLAGLPPRRFASLRLLARKLLNRKIQAGKRGHCSVEDAQAALDLYKLAEGEWEQELQNELRDDGGPPGPSFASSDHYMQDEYWPDDVVADRR
ncbi:interferon-stimulated gene 20 kDa protein-like [Brachionichthys hirsutus]|uniref:interferon-stimulated gene 20 kDa protein-like n=1 Tax=Brachionichthys hirsutus TaxID=412623 RepID=UPI003604FA36